MPNFSKILKNATDLTLIESFITPSKSQKINSLSSNRALFDARGNFMKDYDAAKVLGISPAVLDERMDRISKRDRANIEFGEFVPYQPSRDIIDKFDENARQLGVPNPYLKAEPVIDAISYLLEAAPLSLEALPSIENPFTTPKKLQLI